MVEGYCILYSRSSVEAAGSETIALLHHALKNVTTITSTKFSTPNHPTPCLFSPEVPSANLKA